MKRSYLDYAAAAPVLEGALRAFSSAVQVFGNPSSFHHEGRKAKALLEEARTEIARLGGVKSEHVIFTSGATEANTLALVGTVRTLLASGRTAASIHLLYHEGAHASVVETVRMLQGEGVSVAPLPLHNGAVHVEALSRLSPTLLTIEAIHGETGMHHDLRLIKNAVPHDTLIHVDASQLPLIESFERERLYADLITLDAQKVGGVRGVGALLRSRRAVPTPIHLGGGQEGGLRSGTEPVALVSAFAAALKESAKNRTSFSERATTIKEEALRALRTGIKEVVVLGGKKSAPHVISFALPGIDTDYLQALLDADGFSVGTKSACEGDVKEGSRMAHLETGNPELSLAVLRISFGPQTTKREVMTCIASLIRNVRFLKENAV